MMVLHHVHVVLWHRSVMLVHLRSWRLLDGTTRGIHESHALARFSRYSFISRLYSSFSCCASLETNCLMSGSVSASLAQREVGGVELTSSGHSCCCWVSLQLQYLFLNRFLCNNYFLVGLCVLHVHSVESQYQKATRI